MATTGEVKHLPFFYVQTLDQYQRAIQELEQNRQRLALDSETRSKPGFMQESARLNPHTGQPALLTLKSDFSLPVVFDLVHLEHQEYNQAPLLQLMEQAEYLVAHNAKFDGLMIRGYFKKLLRNLRCTLQLARLLSNATGSKFGKIGRAHV